MDRFKKRAAIALIFTLLLTGLIDRIMPVSAEGQQETIQSVYSQSELDIMFVVDCSNSMNAKDKDKMALQMIGAFINTAFSTRTRIGYTAYNHAIIKAQKPQSINTKKKRDALRKQIEQISRSGSTDIGLALEHGRSLLDTGDQRKSILILISDGETDLTYADTGRTKKDSDKDAQKTAKECAKAGIPIYTIAFGGAYDGSSEGLKSLSARTRAVAYQAPKPEDLVEIFNEITRDSTMSSVIPIGDGISSGNLQSIDVPLDHSEEIREANILVVSSSPIEEASLLYSGTGSSFHRSDYYFTGKIVNPNQDKAQLQLRTRADSNLKIYLKLYHDLDFKVELPKTIKKNEAFVIRGYFYNNDAKRQVTSQAFYKEFSPSIEIKRDGRIAEEAVPVGEILPEDGSLKCSYAIGKAGSYRLDYSMKSRVNSLVLEDVAFTVENDPPAGRFETELTYSPISKEEAFDLNQYFADPNKDVLAYQLEGGEGGGSTAAIENNILRVQPKEPGTYRFRICAADEDGAQIRTAGTRVTVKPLWSYYYGITVLLISAAAFLLLLLLLYAARKLKKAPKPYFSGKLNLYFTKMPDGDEIEPLAFTLYPLEVRELSLEALLDGTGIRIKELDGGRIRFLPSFDKKIVLFHTSSCSVMLGSSIVCRGMKYSVAYGDKIYIASKDGEYELEMHFISARV